MVPGDLVVCASGSSVTGKVCCLAPSLRVRKLRSQGEMELTQGPTAPWGRAGTPSLPPGPLHSTLFPPQPFFSLQSRIQRQMGHVGHRITAGILDPSHSASLGFLQGKEFRYLTAS